MECHHNPLQNGESARIWRAEDIGDLELLDARYISYSFARHTHEGAAIGTIEEGAERFYYRGATHTATAGQIVVFNPDEAHTGQGADKRGWRFRMFYLDALLLERAADGFAARQRGIPFFGGPIIDDQDLAAMLRNLHATLEMSSSRLERQSKFIHTFGRLAQRHADDSFTERPLSREKSAVKSIRLYLESNYTENVSLNTLSLLSGLSPYHLVRVFRAEVGLPPHVYLEQVRINHARQFLRAGTPIAQVAFLTGFTDQSHFNRHFKKMTGVTPGQYQGTITKRVRRSS